MAVEEDVGLIVVEEVQVVLEMVVEEEVAWYVLYPL